jgi:hypothetical protein
MALAKSTVVSIGRQIAKWRLAEFNYGQRQRETFDAKLPAPIIASTSASAAYRQSMPVRFTEIVTPVLALVALAAILLFARSPIERRTILPYLAFAIGALLLNAIICGAISTPHDRYQMRLMWILPFLAVALRTDLGMRSGRLIRITTA